MTIDVEEDNWGTYDRNRYTVKNIGGIPRLQEIFDGNGVKPTYLLNYPIANDQGSVDIFRDILKDGRCEIGTHIHSWNTPPFDSELDKNNSMLCKLPVQLQYEKLKNVHELIRGNFGVSPVSFRSGRWGFDLDVAENIYKLGYRYDTSVTPFTDWTRIGGPDFRMRGLGPGLLLGGPSDGNGYRSGVDLLEVPATIGFTGILSNFPEACKRISSIQNENYTKKLKINYILRKMNIYEKIWLSPESSTLEEMTRLTESLAGKTPFLNMFFHSGSLLAGNTPFVRDAKSQDMFYGKIDRYLAYVRRKNIDSITLAESGKTLPAGTGNRYSIG